MEWLKTLSILLPILVILSGAGIYTFNWYKEPNFVGSQYYTTAWIEYGVNQNTLSIEYVPNGHGVFIPAMKDALKRMATKANLNSKIDSKPLIVIGYARQQTTLVEVVRLPITSKQIQIMLHGTPEERIETLSLVADQAEPNPEFKYILVQRDGHLVKVPIILGDTPQANLTKEYVYSEMYVGDIQHC